nr:replication protein A 14 kDa subunit [Pogona vitticeps]
MSCVSGCPGNRFAFLEESGTRIFPASLVRGKIKRARGAACVVASCVEMADVLEGPRVRVAASQLPQYIGKAVCFVGRLEKIHPSGKFFFLSDGEGKTATIELMAPLEEEISGVIEVVGRVTNQVNVLCASYTQFREDKDTFDIALYNEAVKTIHEFPEYYPFATN